MRAIRSLNFQISDPVRRARAVQYASMPHYPWQPLREDSPGKYEAAVNPMPDPHSFNC